MLLSLLIILTLLSAGTIAGFFFLQARIRNWRLASMERGAFALWQRMNPHQKIQALKRIGVFPLLSSAAAADVDALNDLFDGVLATAREQLRHHGTFDFTALNDELTASLQAAGTAAKTRMAHG